MVKSIKEKKWCYGIVNGTKKNIMVKYTYASIFGMANYMDIKKVGLNEQHKLWQGKISEEKKIGYGKISRVKYRLGFRFLPLKRDRNL